MAHIIVVGNEKGGAGKSTVSMHVATALARMGHRASALDLDLRQRSFGRYAENRQLFMQQETVDLPSAHYHPLPEVASDPDQPAGTTDEQRLTEALETLETTSDFIVIDCPGAHTRLSQVAHSLADTLITPLNDSFIDFDLLANIDGDAQKIRGPSIYSEMVWSARQARAKAGQRAIDWVVLRNRVGSQQMINKEKMRVAIEALAKRIGFRVVPGFNERVIFRELFPRGLTLLDLKDTGVKGLSISNIAARQELRDLVKALNLPGVTVKF